MADNRMKDDTQQRNMGSGREDQDFGKQQAPGRGQGDQQPGQPGQGQQGQKGAPRPMEDDDDDAGGQGQPGGQNRGGQNR